MYDVAQLTLETARTVPFPGVASAGTAYRRHHRDGIRTSGALDISCAGLGLNVRFDGGEPDEGKSILLSVTKCDLPDCDPDGWSTLCGTPLFSLCFLFGGILVDLQLLRVS